MKFWWFIPLFLWSPIGQSRALRVSIDPGHGGRDQGAIHGRIKESNINLKIARKLYRRLKKDPGFEVLLLRKMDRELELPTRLRMSRQFGSDLFISIHANAHRNRKIRGSEIYIQRPETPQKRFLTSPNGQGSLEKIVSDLKKSARLFESYQLGTLVRKYWRQNKKRRIRQAPFFVLNQNSAPALLIEVGYLTNRPERQKLIRNSVQENIAQKIHSALKDYAKNMDKLPRSLLKPGNVQIR